LNHSVAKALIFVAEFDQKGRPTEATIREFEDCIRSAAIWRASLTIIHVKPRSERIRWSRDHYDNSSAQKRIRLIDYALSGLVLRAVETQIDASVKVLYGKADAVISEELQNGAVLWSSVANEFRPAVHEREQPKASSFLSRLVSSPGER
jgi:hypothetical protein